MVYAHSCIHSIAIFFFPIDPYVSVKLNVRGKKQQKWKSSVHKGTLTPVFNEPFQFDISKLDINSVSLEITVKNHSTLFPSHAMGVVHIGEEAAQSQGRCHWSEVLSSPGQSVSHWHALLPAGRPK